MTVMRYRLRTLLILLAALPPALAGIWYVLSKLPWGLPGTMGVTIFLLLCRLVWVLYLREREIAMGPIKVEGPPEAPYAIRDVPAARPPVNA